MPALLASSPIAVNEMTGSIFALTNNDHLVSCIIERISDVCGTNVFEKKEINRAGSTCQTKTISPRSDMIVEIISPFAFTFKIPFH
jgi:hypothetical protein